jgi:hypothetical protein
VSEDDDEDDEEEEMFAVDNDTVMVKEDIV